MKPRIPFRIGYQIDNWENDLVITEDRFKNDSYCSYLWVGKEQKKFLNFEPLSTELVFYWDRLEVVILDFGIQSQAYYDKLNGDLLQRFPEYTKTNSADSITLKYNTLKVSYWNVYYPKTDEIKVMYFSKSFPPKELILKYSQIRLPQTLMELEDMLQEFKKEFTELQNLQKIRELTLSEKNRMKVNYQHGSAIKLYLKKEGKVSNEFIRFYLYFLFKDRRKLK